MAKLQVTISHELSVAFQEMYYSVVHSTSEEIDPQIEADFNAFCESVRCAVQRQLKRERYKRVMEQAKKSLTRA